MTAVQNPQKNMMYQMSLTAYCFVGFLIAKKIEKNLTITSNFGLLITYQCAIIISG